VIKISKIQQIHAREVLDSRGNPTVEAEVTVKNQVFRAIVPSGASTGIHEALELRDKEKKYNGKGVEKAVKNINNIISKSLIGISVRNQKKIDKIMLKLDGTKNKTNLGANAMLAVSMACTRAGAFARKMELYEYIAFLSGNKKLTLPQPQMNVMNGGRHAGMDNDIQELMLVPTKAKNFKHALQMCVETYHTLKKLLKEKFNSQATLLGDEGGFAPPLKTAEERLDMMTKAIKKAGYEGKIQFAIDAASSEFYEKKRYTIGDKKYSSEELIKFYEKLVKKYPIISLEDGMAEDDWKGWTELTKKLGNKVQIVGDDLLVTNPKRIKKAIKTKACNSLLLKVNQIGTITEAIKAANLAFENNWTVVVSHRSGETEDSFIADLVVGLGTGQSKFGAPGRSERVCKYNQLLRIEENLK